MCAFNPAAAWDVRRFRPNFLIETAAGIEKPDRSRLGKLSLRIGEGIAVRDTDQARCGMTTHAQGDLPGIHRCYCSIVKPGKIWSVYASAISGGRSCAERSLELL